jgi:alpha-tubulin suppressor-like RCC1 family protein
MITKKYDKFIIISQYIENKELFISSINNDVLELNYDNENVNELLEIIKKNRKNEDLYISLVYHSDMTNSMPFFENIKNENNNEYEYFSNEFILFVGLLNELNDENKTYIDLITINDCGEDYYDEIMNIENNLKNIKIRHKLSVDKNTLNNNWILESDNVDLVNLYFNEKIRIWNYTLSLLSYNNLQGHFGPIYDNNRSRVFHMKDIHGNPINEKYNNQNRNIKYAPSKLFIENIDSSIDNNKSKKKTLVEDVVSIYPNTYAVVALKNDGSIYCWGKKEYGGALSGSGGKGSASWNGPSKQLTMENPQLKVISIYGTKNSFCALLENGTVSCWGNKQNGGTTPRNLMNVKEIYTTESAFCALKNDGSIYCWGNKNNGGLKPKKDKKVKCIYSNSTCFCALYDDGSIESWGNKNNGGFIDNELRKDLVNIKYVLGNYGSFCALKTNGTIKCWGKNNYGGSSPKGLNYVKDIYSTNYSYCALKNDGSISCWGNNKYGGNTIPDNENYGFIQIYSTENSFCGLRNDGTIYCWGVINKIPEILVSKYIKAVYTNYISFSAIYDENNFVYWGEDLNKTKNIDNVVKADGELYNMSVILQNGDVYNWGYDTGIKHIESAGSIHINTVNTKSTYNSVAGLNNNIDSLNNKKNYTDIQLNDNYRGLLLNGVSKFLESDRINSDYILFDKNWTLEFMLRLNPKYNYDKPIYILNKISNNKENTSFSNNEFSVIYNGKENVLKILSVFDKKIEKSSKLLVTKSNEFHHYSFTYNNKTSTLKGYRDDKLVLNKSIKNLSIKQNEEYGKLFVGSLVEDSNKNSEIEIYNLRIWNTCRTKDELINYRHSELNSNVEGLVYNCQFIDSNLNLDNNVFMDLCNSNIDLYYHGSIVDEGLLKDIPQLNNLLLYYNNSKDRNIIKNNNLLHFYSNTKDYNEENGWTSLEFDKKQCLSTLLPNIRSISMWYKLNDLFKDGDDFSLLDIFNGENDYGKLYFNIDKMNNKTNVFYNCKIYINSVLVKNNDDNFDNLLFNKLGFNQYMNELVNIVVVLNKPISNNLFIFNKCNDKNLKIDIGNIHIYNSVLQKHDIERVFNDGLLKYKKVFELIKTVKPIVKVKVNKLEEKITNDKNNIITMEIIEEDKDIGTVVEVDSASLCETATILETIVDDDVTDIGNLDNIEEEPLKELKREIVDGSIFIPNEITEEIPVETPEEIPVETPEEIPVENHIIERILLIEENLDDMNDLLNSINKNTRYIINNNIKISELLENIDENINHLGFVYHGNRKNTMPYFNKGNSTYKFFSDEFIELLIELKMKNPNIIIDLLACNLKHPLLRKELNELMETINIKIRYSIDETGNKKDGGDWILESDNINIKDLYFNEYICNWDILLRNNDNDFDNLQRLKKLNCSREKIIKLTSYKLSNDELIKDKIVDSNNKDIIHNSLDIIFKRNSNIDNFKIKTDNLCLDNRINKKYLKVIKSGKEVNVNKELDNDTGLYVNLSLENDYVSLKLMNKNIVINRIENDNYELFRDINKEPEIFKSGEIINIDSYKIEFGGASVDDTSLSGSGGDPYITTLYNMTYKLQDKPGIYRIYEGKNIIINAETSMIDEKQREKILDYGYNMNTLIKTGTLYTRLFIRNEDDSCIIDLKNRKIITNKRNKTIFIGDNNYSNSNFVLYNNIKCLKKPIIIKNKYHKNIILCLEYFDIPQIENSFNVFVERIPCYKEHIGLLVDNFKQKNMKVISLTDISTKMNKNKKYEKVKSVKGKYEYWLGITNNNQIKNM